MKDAECFIEQWRCKTWQDHEFNFTCELPISSLKLTLEETIQVGCKTIAVFKIKPKVLITKTNQS